LIKIGVKKDTIKETLHIKIQVPEYWQDENIGIFDSLNTKTICSFHSRILDLKKGNKKDIIFTLDKFQYNKELIFRIFHKGEYIFRISIFIPEKGKIFFWSTLKDERYSKSCCSLRLDVHNKTLAYILNDTFKIPYGKKQM